MKRLLIIEDLVPKTGMFDVIIKMIIMIIMIIIIIVTVRTYMKDI